MNPSDSSTITDITQIRLSSKSHSILTAMKESGQILEMADGFRLGVALALALGDVPPELPPDKDNYISTSSLDPNRSLAKAINLLANLDGIPVYRYAERLADYGIGELYDRFGDGFLDVASLFNANIHD